MIFDGFHSRISFRLLTINDEPICSARGTIITFILIVVIIMTVAITVGVVFSTIKIGSNATANAEQSSYWYTSSLCMNANDIRKIEFFLF